MGKIKEKYFCEALAEYAKRLSRYCALETVELSPVQLPEKPSEGEALAALKREAELIRKRIPKNAETVALCVEARPRTSEEFAEYISRATNAGRPLCFIIGSSYGLDADLKRECTARLSLSEMTFPHRLFRVMLYEQLYRAFKINEGGSYHK